MRPDQPRTSRMKWVKTLGLVCVLFASVWGYRLHARWEKQRTYTETLHELPIAAALRVDLRSTLLASGKTDSSEKTKIECEVERLAMSNEGRAMVASSGATILSMVDDGTLVKKGDLVCTLDASEYEEFVRLQEIKVQRAHADLLQAKLNYESAQMALEQYQDGLARQVFEELDGALALRETDVTRAKDRLAWSRRMLQKGYASFDTVRSAELSLNNALLDLRLAQWDKNLYSKFGVPRQLKILNAAIESAKATLMMQTTRVERFDDRLVHYKKQVENCTIRAPQDGMIIYANEPWRGVVIEPGVQVRQHQDLFYLPDLTKMQVLAYVHESVATRISPGMRARARIEGLDNRELEGHVLKIDPLPYKPSSVLDNKFFITTILLDSVPRGIRPEMSAEVEIVLDRHEQVVAVPSESVTYDHGRPFCFVLHPDGVERREVRLGFANRDLLEVEAGVREGESVLLNPKLIDGLTELVYDTPLPEVDSTRTATNESEADQDAKPVTATASSDTPPHDNVKTVNFDSIERSGL